MSIAISNIYMYNSTAQVSNAEVVVVNDTSIRVSWDPITDPGISGYIILYTSTLDGNDTQQKNITSTEPLPVLISGLSPEVEYQFQVQAVVEVDGEVFHGGKSKSVTVTTAGMYIIGNCFSAISHFVRVCMHELVIGSLYQESLKRTVPLEEVVLVLQLVLFWQC